MGTYDIMQVCLNGHRITQDYRSSPERRQQACSKCGASTIHACPECGTNIRGTYRVPNVISASTKAPPSHCHNCGEPYPWTDDAEEFADLDPSELDPELREKCIPKYENQHYQAAVRSAFVALEERLRDMGGFDQSLVGADLATQALNPDGGPLAFGETGGEQQGVMFLYRGAIQALRNPSGHRFVEDIDEAYARDVLHTVNLLLRLLEENN